MRIDFRANPRLARLHDVLDAETGENLNHLGIVAANDAKGTMRVLAFDDDGQPVCDDLGRQTTVETNRKIRVVPKPECQGAISLPTFER